MAEVLTKLKPKTQPEIAVYHAAIAVDEQKAAALLKAIRESDQDRLWLKHCQLQWAVLKWLQREPTDELRGEIVGFCSALSTVIVGAIRCGYFR